MNNAVVSKDHPNLYLSLWSIRYRMFEKPKETFKLIENWFSGVEIAGFFNWDAYEFRNKLKPKNLEVCSIHGPLLRIGNNLQFYVDWAKEYLDLFETNTLVFETSVRDIPEAKDSIKQKYQENISTLITKIATELFKYNKKVSYHCFPHDFTKINGSSQIERIFLSSELPENLGLQLDTFWLNYANVNPEIYSDLPVHSVHLNERDNDGHCCELGTNEEKCIFYVEPLAKRKVSIDWILENDPADNELKTNDSLMIKTMEKCVKEWPDFWSRISSNS